MQHTNKLTTTYIANFAKRQQRRVECIIHVHSWRDTYNRLLMPTYTWAYSQVRVHGVAASGITTEKEKSLINAKRSVEKNASHTARGGKLHLRWLITKMTLLQVTIYQTFKRASIKIIQGRHIHMEEG